MIKLRKMTLIPNIPSKDHYNKATHEWVSVLSKPPEARRILISDASNTVCYAESKDIISYNEYLAMYANKKTSENN